MPVNYNEPLTFGRNGTVQSLETTGLDFSENDSQSWTIAPVVNIELPLAYQRGGIVMDIEATPFIFPDKVPLQNAFIFMGGLFVGFFSLKGHAIRSFPIAQGGISGRNARLSIVIPTAVSPASLLISEDERELGLHLSSLFFRSTA